MNIFEPLVRFSYVVASRGLNLNLFSLLVSPPTSWYYFNKLAWKNHEMIKSTIQHKLPTDKHHVPDNNAIRKNISFDKRALQDLSNYDFSHRAGSN